MWLGILGMRLERTRALHTLRASTKAFYLKDLNIQESLEESWSQFPISMKGCLCIQKNKSSSEFSDSPFRVCTLSMWWFSGGLWENFFFPFLFQAIR